MTKPLVITVRVNEYAMRDGNPNIPYTPEEIAETAAEYRAAGASIIHFHARNADGTPCHAPETYAEIVARIRQKTDILIDSTLGQITVKEEENRLAHVELIMGAVAEPAYVQCVLAEGGIVGAHPCTTRGLEALIDFMPPHRRIEWTVACKEGNVFNVASTALERGGHLAPGIGDHPYPELGRPTNAALVRRVAELGRAMGRPVATTGEARAARHRAIGRVAATGTVD